MLATLDSLPGELIAEIVAYLNLEMPRRALASMGGEAWKMERLMFAMLFSYCICDHCCPDHPPPGWTDIGVFPLPVKDGVNALSSVNRRLRAMTLDASRKRSVMHMFDDIESLLKATKGKSAPQPTSVPPPRIKFTARKPARPRPCHAPDGTPIRYTLSPEEAETLAPGWERHLHGILYRATHEESTQKETTPRATSKPSTDAPGAHDNIRNLLIGFNHHLRPGSLTSLSRIDFLKQYPNLRALLIDWYRTPTPLAGDTAPSTLVTSTTLQRLDIRLSEPPDAPSRDGIHLAHQLGGIIRQLALPNLEEFHLIHRMPVDRGYVRGNWEAIIRGLRGVAFPTLRVVRVSLWLGGGPLKHPFWLWKTALRDLLEHFRSHPARPKIILCLFYDISDFDDLNLTSAHFPEPNLRPSLAPTQESMDKFMAAYVRPFPAEKTCEFDLVVHAAPAEDEAYGADRPHVPIVTVEYRRPSPSSQPTTPRPADDFHLHTHQRAIGRLAAEVSAYSGVEEEDVVMRAAFHQMAMHIERNPQLREEMGFGP